MQSSSISRRRALGAAGALAALAATPFPAQAAATPLSDAYAFLDSMMDRHASGSTLRLAQSYVSNSVLKLGDAAFTYDNTLVLIAYLQRNQPGDLTRATTLGRSLVYAQDQDPIGDGRVRDGYHTNPFILSNGSVNINTADGDQGTDCGNMAWTGLALCHLYRALVAAGQPAADILAAAVKTGQWIQTHSFDTRGAGGYTSGYSNKQAPLSYKSTELNTDIHALFTMLATLDDGPTWTPRAAHALAFVNAMWSAGKGFFWVGTGNDGVTLNKDFKAEDTQSWTWLATLDPAHAGSVDWAVANLARTDGPYTGVCFSTADKAGVWFEGSGHMASALLVRGGAGDAARAQGWLQSIELAQSNGVDGSRQGVPAASRKLPTGDGDSYFVALHIGATAWYAIGKQAGNPLRLA
jgi:hypothetical protein